MAPVSLRAYLLYRIGLRVVIAFFITLIAVPLAGLGRIPFSQLVLAAALSSLSGGIVALAVTALAKNKVEGFGVLKVLQGAQALPLVAWFVPAAYWRMAVGEGYWVVGGGFGGESAYSCPAHQPLSKVPGPYLIRRSTPSLLLDTKRLFC